MRIKSIISKAINIPGSSMVPWIYGTSFSNARNKHASTIDNIGNIYISGGSNSSNILGSVEKYNISGNSWSSVANLNTPRHRHAMTYDLSNNIYVFGGSEILGITTNTLNSVEVYNSGSNSWSYVAPMLNPRKNFSAVTSSSGKIYVIGGTTPSNTIINSIDEYDPTLDSWTNITTMPLGLTLSAAVYHGGKIYIYGGDNNVSNPPLSNLYSYDISSDTWDSSLAPMNNARIAFAGGSLDNALFAISGTDGVELITSVEMYKISHNEWTNYSILNTSRFFHSSAYYNNSLYVFGGNDGTSILNSLEILTF